MLKNCLKTVYYKKLHKGNLPLPWPLFKQAAQKFVYKWNHFIELVLERYKTVVLNRKTHPGTQTWNLKIWHKLLNTIQNGCSQNL